MNRILSDEEIEKVFEHRAELMLDSIKAKKIVTNMIDRKKANLVSSILLVNGNIENNPKDLICSKCGCKYVAKYEYGEVLYRLFHGTKEQIEEENLRLNEMSLYINISPYAPEERDKDHFCLGCGYEWRKSCNQR